MKRGHVQDALRTFVRAGYWSIQRNSLDKEGRVRSADQYRCNSTGAQSAPYRFIWLIYNL
jgi:hypothetical protein